ncbi:mucin-associated surface protein (MASP) [Trypanosoma cruzi]|nr:mucin-associated surface protein (MASP) [Trypanosoma cruzi]
MAVRWLCVLQRPSLFLLLLPLCVDGFLVCAEGYTQVTGVMAMMMTGLVLLACALCVLWCGAGVGYAEDVDVVSGDPGTRGERGGGDKSSLADGSHGGSGGSNGDSSHESESEPSDSASNEKSLNPQVDEDEDPNSSEQPLRQGKEGSKGKQDHSQSAPQNGSPHKVNGAETLDSAAQVQLSATPNAELNTNVADGEIASGGSGNTGHNTGLSPNSSDSSAPPVPPAMTVPAGDTNPTASKDLQNIKETTSTTPPSNSKTAAEAPQTPSGNGAPKQHRKESDTPDLKDAPASHTAESTAKSIYTMGSDGAQKNEEKFDNGDQRSNRKETQDGLEDRNTDDAPTASETEPETATTQKNATPKFGDSDGSTAVSHTTSPLLLLTVACAAAAVVAA